MKPRVMRNKVPAAWVAVAILWCMPRPDGSSADCVYRVLGEKRDFFSPMRSYHPESVAKLKRSHAAGKVGRWYFDETMRRFTERKSILESLPAEQAAAVGLLPEPYGCFAVHRVEGQLVVDAVSMATPEFTELDEHRQIGPFADSLSDLPNLRSIVFRDYLKAGLSFEALGRLEFLEALSPPVDTTDEDLLSMRNLANLTHLDLMNNIAVTGSFLRAFPKEGNLRYLRLWGARVAKENLHFATQIPTLEKIEIYPDSTLSRSELELALEDRSIRNEPSSGKLVFERREPPLTGAGNGLGSLLGKTILAVGAVGMLVLVGWILVRTKAGKAGTPQQPLM